MTENTRTTDRWLLHAALGTAVQYGLLGVTTLALPPKAWIAYFSEASLHLPLSLLLARPMAITCLVAAVSLLTLLRWGPPALVLRLVIVAQLGYLVAVFPSIAGICVTLWQLLPLH